MKRARMEMPFDMMNPVIQECSDRLEEGFSTIRPEDRYLHEVQDCDGDWASEFIVLESGSSSSGSPPRAASARETRRKAVKGGTEPALVWCSLCSKEVFLEEICCMPNCACLFCKPCLHEFITDVLRFVPTNSDELILCPELSCIGTFAIAECQALAPRAFSTWADSVSRSLLQQNEVFQPCPRCGIPIEKVAGDVPLGLDATGVPELDRTTPCITEVDDAGLPLSRSAVKHRILHRFRCTHCNTDFCGGCGRIPYHTGSTCSEYQRVQELKKCRYCDQPVEGGWLEVDGGLDEHPNLDHMTTKTVKKLLEKEGVDVKWCLERRDILQVYSTASACCKSLDCRLKLRNQCTKFLGCGHACGGIKQELKCPPCLQSHCREASASASNSSNVPDHDDLCSICWVEELGKAPIIQLACGHFMHFHCAKMKIEKGTTDIALNFNYIQCPLCSSVMDHPSLKSILSPHLKLKQEVLNLAMERIKLDGRFDSAPELSPGGSFAGNPEGYALHNLLYYLCFKCKHAYYGGERRCHQIENERLRPNHKPEDLVCGDCAYTVSREGVCLKGHGTKFVEYKCRFCCSVATYFCFGTTHFCNSCHYIRSAHNPGSLPKCEGRHACPLQVDHPPNGNEFCLGCALCRIERNKKH